MRKFNDNLLKSDLLKLDDHQFITLKEVGLLLGVTYQRVLQLIQTNRVNYKKSLYPFCLNDYIKKARVYEKRPVQKCIKRKHLSEFEKYKAFYTVVREIKEKQVIYRHEMRKKYGLESFHLKECSKNDFNCEKCIEVETCKLYNSQVSSKTMAKMFKLFKNYNDFSYFKDTKAKYESKLQEYEGCFLRLESET